MLHNPLQLAPAVILTRPDEGGEQAGTLHSGCLKGSDTPVLCKTRINSGQFHAVLSENFSAHKILSLKFMEIFTDDQGTFT